MLIRLLVYKFQRYLINILINFERKTWFAIKRCKGCLYSFDSWSYCDDRNIIAKDNFYPLKKIEFEGDKYYVPNNYIYILEELYGYDFYTFPCGEPHFVHADWKKNEKF